MNKSLRAGMTGGVMGTLALTAGAAPAFASDSDAQKSETVEMPALSGELASSSQQAADSLVSNADRAELELAQKKAASEAHKQAKETKQKAEAKQRAEEARKAEAREKAQERAERSSERTTLAADSGESSTSTSSSEAGSGSAATVLDFVRAQVGKSYVMGATGPSSYDCSGLTSAAFKQVGVDLPRMSQEQSSAGTQVPVDSAQPGDILYWGDQGSAYHVAVYMGDGKFIGAQNSSTGVVEKDLDYDPPTGAVRVL